MLHASGAYAAGQRLLFLMVATVALVAFFAALRGGDDTVTVLVRSESGESAVYDLSLLTGSLSNQGDPSWVYSQEHGYFFNDGSIIRLESAGIVRREGSTEGPVSVLVASPVPPTERTPFTVWNRGARVAWVNPADRSIQIFEVGAMGSYAPRLIHTSLVPNSLQFSNDGSTLLLSVLSTTYTDIYELGLDGELTKLHTLPGLVSLVEKMP